MVGLQIEFDGDGLLTDEAIEALAALLIDLADEDNDHSAAENGAEVAR